jgi:hypothetical protein
MALHEELMGPHTGIVRPWTIAQPQDGGVQA